MSGFRISSVNGIREYSSASIFQGEVSGGSVQTFTGGSIEKISGAGSYNAGASSVQKIDGQKDGYVQFQIGHATHSLKIGLVNQDHDFEVDAPWKMNFGGGYIDLSSPWIADHTAFNAGDWFRIRHYSQENEIVFQKREEIFDNGESIGEDYVTFYTHPVLSNGDDLYIDTVFHAVGARLNDVQIAYK